MIERVFRERWRRVLASMVGYVGDFDLDEKPTQEAFAMRAQAARDDRDDQRMGLLGGPGPDRASNARFGTDAGTNMPTHRGPAEDELR